MLNKKIYIHCFNENKTDPVEFIKFHARSVEVMKDVATIVPSGLRIWNTKYKEHDYQEFEDLGTSYLMEQLLQLFGVLYFCCVAVLLSVKSRTYVQNANPLTKLTCALHLDSHIYKRNNNNNIKILVHTGKKEFKLGLTVRKNLESLAINGIDLRTRLLTRHTEQVITAPYYFVSVDVRASLHILGLYNNRNLAAFSSLGFGGRNVVHGSKRSFVIT